VPTTRAPAARANAAAALPTAPPAPLHEQCASVEVAEREHRTRRCGRRETRRRRLLHGPVLRDVAPCGQHGELRGRVAHATEAEDDVADIRAGDAGPHLVDDSDGIPAGNRGEGQGQCSPEDTAAQQDVDRVHTGGEDSDPHRAGAGVRLGRVFDGEHLGGAVFVEACCAHEVSETSVGVEGIGPRGSAFEAYAMT
jgi:hypothetical protein